MDMLTNMLKIGALRTNADGSLKFPNFKLIKRLMIESNLDYEKALLLISIDDDSIIRVIREAKNSVFFAIDINGKYEIISQQNESFEKYRDELHKQVRGGGYIEWKNSDFLQPFTSEMILNRLGWRNLFIKIENNIDFLILSNELDFI